LSRRIRRPVISTRFARTCGNTGWWWSSDPDGIVPGGLARSLYSLHASSKLSCCSKLGPSRLQTGRPHGGSGTTNHACAAHARRHPRPPQSFSACLVLQLVLLQRPGPSPALTWGDFIPADEHGMKILCGAAPRLPCDTAQMPAAWHTGPTRRRPVRSSRMLVCRSTGPSWSQFQSIEAGFKIRSSQKKKIEQSCWANMQ